MLEAEQQSTPWLTALEAAARAEVADSEYRLARDLAAVWRWLPLALGQPRETGCHLDRQRDRHGLQDEHRRLCTAILREDWRAA